MKILFVSLGCDKNLVDSEIMLGLTRDRGFEITNDESEADVIVVNTCAFINDAKQESIETILEMAEYKETGVLKALIVTGCLAQRYKEEIYNEIPEVDGIVGSSSYDEIVSVIDSCMEGQKRVSKFKELEYMTETETHRIVTTGGTFSYLKIAEGCDKHCTYCIIPSLRGKYRSVPMERLLKQAKELADNGVKELMLVAQETTLYGVDLYGEKTLPRLLRELCKIEGIEWIRILYCYPEEITDELIQVMKEEKKICHYLDMPIQHGTDEILKRMARRTNKQEIMDIVTKLRNNIPDIVLRTTLITGFPGETEELHQELIEFVKEMKFERLGVFTYSKEEDTPAAKFKGHVTKKVKEARQRELMEVQQEIAFEHAKSMIGKELEVMIEGKLPEEGEEPGEYVYIGRTYMDAPNIDGYIFVNVNDIEIMSGTFAKVKVVDANGYDLIGELA